MSPEKKRSVFIFCAFLAVAVPFFLWLRFRDDSGPSRKRKGWGDPCTRNTECYGRHCLDGVCTQACETDKDCPNGDCVDAELQYGQKKLAGLRVCRP